MIWFSSDLHLGHANILQYCNRPFKNINEMDEALISNWNSVVADDDDVYFLGDFCLGDLKMAERYFAQLNGIINVLQNSYHHDARWQHPIQLLFSKDFIVKFLPPIHVLEIPEYAIDGRPKPIVLCHYPIHVWDRQHYGSWHLYGHVHIPAYAIPGGKYSMNVGVDCNNYYPVSLEEVAKKFMSNGL